MLVAKLSFALDLCAEKSGIYRNINIIRDSISRMRAEDGIIGDLFESSLATLRGMWLRVFQ